MGILLLMIPIILSVKAGKNRAKKSTKNGVSDRLLSSCMPTTIKPAAR